MISSFFDKIDRYGSIVGRVGSGDKVLLFDSDPDQWQWDPFQGHIDEEGNFYALGALDEKGSTPGMVYGIALARDLGLLNDYTIYYLGNIEEWCDGVGCKAFLEWENVRPDFMVVGEPTKMEVYRGHKGRVELAVVCQGISAHAASNYLGDNAVYKMLPVLGCSRSNQVLCAAAPHVKKIAKRWFLSTQAVLSFLPCK